MFGPSSNEEFEETYHDKREQDISSLQSFFLNLSENHFDNSIDDLIIEKKKSLKELEEKINRKDEFHIDYGIILIPQELLSLSETKVIHCFKNFETHLKILIKGSYQESVRNQMFRWDYIITFLKSKNIDIKKFKSYEEINQLRIVNNSIKHSKLNDDNEVRSMKEFKDINYISYSDLLDFYERIKNSPEVFISELCDSIYSDLYEFDDNRITNISEKILSRLNEGNIQSLIKKLKEGTQ